MIDKNQVKNIAKLARIGISESEKLEEEISSILDYFKELEEVDTSKTKPVFHSCEEFIDHKNIMREDEAKPEAEDTINKIIKAAPDKEGRRIKVKAIWDL